MDTVHAARRRLALAAASIVVLVGALYLPLRHGGFIWDDTSSLHDQAWLRDGNWLAFVFHGFNGWVNYFRPLIVLTFVGELRAFGGAPGPMHLVSIGLHLTDVVLVGLLAYRLAARAESARRMLAAAFASGSMLLYGFHPALIEPVSWIGCQFELAAVLFMLLGLLLNESIAGTAWRAGAVSASFLVAAGFKESAAAFPALLVLFDLLPERRTAWSQALRAVWKRQRAVYGSVLVAAGAYLVTRHWALGHTVLTDAGPAMPLVARMQLVAATYLHYWQLVVWPMSTIGPIHPYDPGQFSGSARSLATIAGALAIFAAGAYGFYRRRIVGTVVVAVSVSLLPVLNLLPVTLGESYYHDRYATTAIAVASVMLPLLLLDLAADERVRALRLPGALALAIWLLFAVVNVRVTVPLWADEVALWQWASRQHPESIDIKQHLLATYIARNDRPRARLLADELVADPRRCPFCMLNAADLALADGDGERAERALGRLSGEPMLEHDPRFLRGYILASGRLLEVRRDVAAAETAYRNAMSLDAFDPLPHMALASLLAHEGRRAEAQQEAENAFALFAADERDAWRRKFDQALSSAPESAPTGSAHETESAPERGNPKPDALPRPR